MLLFDDLYTEFLMPVLAEEAIAIRGDVVGLLCDDTPIYDKLNEIVNQDTPIEARVSDFDIAIIECSDEYLQEYLIEVTDTTNISTRGDMIRTIREVREYLDPENVITIIENSINSLEAFGELCAIFGQQTSDEYIQHLHYVGEQTITDILNVARANIERNNIELTNDIKLLQNFVRYINSLDERTKAHYEIFADGLCECYTFFEHGMGLYIDEIKHDLEDDFGIACLKLATLYSLSKDKESIPDEGLIADLTKSIGEFIDSQYLNQIVVKTLEVLKKGLSYADNAQ